MKIVLGFEPGKGLQEGREKLKVDRLIDGGEVTIVSLQEFIESTHKKGLVIV